MKSQAHEQHVQFSPPLPVYHLQMSKYEGKQLIFKIYFLNVRFRGFHIELVVNIYLSFGNKSPKITALNFPSPAIIATSIVFNSPCSNMHSGFQYN